MRTDTVQLLRKRIFSGQWREGQFLPPERELARELGIGRSSLREAVAQLISDGLLIVVRGHGTRVRSWLTNGSLALFSDILRYRHGEKNCPELVRQVLWLRRTLYVQCAPLLVGGTPDLTDARSELRRLYSYFGPQSRYRPYVLAAEERLLCVLAMQTENLLVMMLAHGIRRMLEHLYPFSDLGEELPEAREQFEALVAGIEAKNVEQTSSLFDELCRLREPVFLALATPSATEAAAS